MDQETLKRTAVRPRPAAPPPAPRAVPIRLIAGGAALLVVLALVVLVPRVGGLGNRAHATSTTAHTTPLPPTATATPPTAASAWSAAISQHALRLSDGTTFTPTDVAPNGAFLVGYAIAQANAPYFIAAVAVPSFSVQRLFTLPADATKPVVKTDGTFVAWMGGDTPTSAGTLHQTIGYVTLATGRYVELYDTFALQYDPRFFAVANGQFLWSAVKAPASLNTLDMATGNSAPLALRLPAGATLSTLTVVWPLLVYSASDESVHCYDAQKGTDTVLSALTFAAASDRLALGGTTLYWAHPDAATGMQHITAFAPVTDPNAVGYEVTMLTTAHLTQLSAGTRLVVWDDGQQRRAYDLVRHAAALIGADDTGEGPQLGQQGTALWYRTDSGGQPSLALVNLQRI